MRVSVNTPTNPGTFLRILLLITGIVWFSGSCKKSHSGSNMPANNNFVSSVNIAGPGTRTIDSFVYDNVHRLLSFQQYAWDTSSGTPAYGSLAVNFDYAGSSNTPYDYGAFSNGSSTGTLHKIYYDGQNRIIKDTCVTVGAAYVAYFSYPANAIGTTVLFNGTPGDHQIDSMYLSNGNIAHQRIWYPNMAGTADSLEGDDLMAYSSVVNPLYHAPISSSIGPMLNLLAIDGFGNFSDFVSPNLLQKEWGIGDGLPAGGYFGFTPVMDNLSRVVQLNTNLSGSGTKSSIVFKYY